MEPKVNLTTGEIYGARRGTIQWYHEAGHVKFNKTLKGIGMNYRADFFMKLCILLLVVIQIPFFNNFGIKFIMVSFAGLWLYYYFYEEVWCWKYALIKVKEVKRDEKKKNRFDLS